MEFEELTSVNAFFFIGIPIDEQRLTLGGISLDDELTLDECHVEEESTLYVLLDLEGGGKKRKKKSYNTPKKNKHKKKKVKLAVLKYYKVKNKKNTRILFIIKCFVYLRLKILVKSIVYVGNVHQNNAVPVYSWHLIMIVIIVANVV
jgi:hypothetical protein